MIAYPRWKIVLVAIALVLGILLALPNLFGEENALQFARGIAPPCRTAIGRPSSKSSRARAYRSAAHFSNKAV